MGVSQSSQLELSISVIPFFDVSQYIIGHKDDFVKRFLYTAKKEAAGHLPVCADSIHNSDGIIAVHLVVIVNSGGFD